MNSVMKKFCFLKVLMVFAVHMDISFIKPIVGNAAQIKIENLK